MFDAGRRQALSEQAQAPYANTVATYRQTVLSAFQDVENNLAALRILKAESVLQDKAVEASETALGLAINRYKPGISTYLEAIAAQSVTLTAKKNGSRSLDEKGDGSGVADASLGRRLVFGVMFLSP